MSLDVYLTGAPAPQSDLAETEMIFIRRNGRNESITRTEWDELYPGREPVTVKVQPAAAEDLWSYNITHNLGEMADAAGLYLYLWRPEQVGVKIARQLIDPLGTGLMLLRSEPERFKKFNPANGWGDYDGLVKFVAAYLDACIQFPDARVDVSR